MKTVTVTLRMTKTTSATDERMISQLADAIGDGLLTVDSQGRIVSANARALALVGRAGLIGEPLLELFDPEWIAQLADLPPSTRLEVPLQRVNGPQRWVEYVYLPDGEARSLAVLRDISERVGLRSSTRRYQALFEQTNDAVFIISLDGIHLDANPRALEMLGYSMEELIGSPVEIAIPEQELYDSRRVLDELRAGKQPPIYQRIFRRKNGEEFPAELNVSLGRDPQGSPLYIQVIARDITERRVIEQTLHDTLTSVEALYTISHAMIASNTLEDLLLSFADISSVHPQSIALYDVAADRFGTPERIVLAVKLGTQGIHADPNPVGTEYPIAQLELWGRLARERQILYIPDLAHQAPPPTIRQPERILNTGIHALLFVPLISQRGTWVGIVVLGWTELPRLSDPQVQLYNVAAPQLATLVENRRLFEHAEQMLEQLTISQQRLQTVLNNAPVVLFVVDADERITLMQGSSIHFTDAMTSAMLSDLPADLATQVRRALRGEDNPAIVDINATAYEIRFSPLRDEDGTRTGVIGVATDITERRRFENALHHKVQQLTALRLMEAEIGDYLNIEYVIMMALDAAVRISAADSGFIALLEDERLRVAQRVGPPPDEKLISTPNSSISRVFKAQSTLLLSGEAIDYPSTPDPVARILHPLIFRDRPMGVLVLETATPERFSQETSEFIELLMARIPVALDNARLVRLIETQLAEVRKLEQLKTDMIRIASHDLRNPLATISGYLELMRWDLSKLPAETRDYLDNIQRALERMQKITSDILSLERIEETAREGGLDRVNLREMAERAFADMLDTARKKKIIYTLTALPEPLEVMGDSVQLHEAMVNLIGNAIKYTPESGNVDVILRRSDDLAIFEVRDTGYGIPEDKQARLFEPFYRVKTRETKTIEGTGLGLHLVKNIVERHNGAMIVISEYGKGSTFGFSMKPTE